MERDVVPPRSGYKVIEAVDAAEGVSKAASGRPDLVLMEIHLPMLDSYGEKPCKTVMPSNGTSGAMLLLRIFAWRFAAYGVRFCPLRVLRRATGPTITVC